MHKLRLILISLLCGALCGAPISGRAAESAKTETPVVIENLTPESEVENNYELRTWTGRHGVIVRHGSTTLVGEQITLNEVTGDVVADGAVSFRRDGEYWTGPHLEYNYKTRLIKGREFRAGVPPAFITGMSLTATTTNQTYVAQQAVLTTDDVDKPFYKIKAKTLKVTVGKSIEAKQATLYLGDAPVMWLPFYHRSLERHPNYFSFTPGYRSLYGPYLLGSYHYTFTDGFTGAMNVDTRQKRGVGYGPDFAYDVGQLGKGELRLYRTEDNKPGTDAALKPIPEDRHRISFAHQATLRTNLTAKVVVREQSDAFIVRDFFESEYRGHAQPPSYLEVNQLWSNFSLDVLAQPQVNDFYQTVERLPDIKLTAARQQLGVSPLFYEGENSAGYFRFRSASPTGTNYAAMRADSYHQIVLPETFFGWLNVTPRVGGRFTHYSEADGYKSTTTEEDRGVFNTGAETSMKVSRVWGGVRNRLLDMDGMRHIFEPSVNYVYVPTPNVQPRQLPQFDTEIPSLRLLPIDFPDYNAIDSVDTQNVLRFTLRNKLQTKREQAVDNVVNWGLYTDWRLNPRPGQYTFADFFSDLDFKPRNWLTFNSETRFDLQTEGFRGANHTVTINPNNTWSVKLGHRYFRGDDAAFGPDSDDNLIFSSLYYRFNENWGARVSHHFEARDGTMQEQYYTLYRDFRSWTGALTFRVRENRTGPADYAVAFTFSMKAFPTFRQGSDRNQPSLLLGS